MGLENLLGQSRLKSKVEDGNAIDSGITEDIKTFGRHTGTIFSAQKTFLRNANITLHDIRTSSGLPPLTIDASVFTDQSKPTVSLKQGKKGTSETSTFDVIEKKKKQNRKQTKEQEVKKKKDKSGGKKVQEKSACTSETCEEEKIKRETCAEKSMRRELLDEEISPTKLSEMINNSIKEAVQTIVKQCSMET